jgi:hypothetical protein
MGYLKNDFCLITHNSDREIRETPEILTILNTKNLKKWYCQNLCFEHEKLCFLPIGIANSMWPHGNLDFHLLPIDKSKNVFFNFNINTNPNKREVCYESLKTKLEWLPNISPNENIKRLSEYKFCICPEGNGVDTHRLWEALYVKTIPIVIQSEFTKILIKNKIPLIVLNNWDEFDETTLVYIEPELFNFLF